jgi:hypothetical protein
LVTVETKLRNVDQLSHQFEIPRLGALARHAVPHVIEATLIPLGLFYLSLWRYGTEGAIFTAVAWGYLAVLRRLVLRQRVPGILLLSTLGLTARTVIALAAHRRGRGAVPVLHPCRPPACGAASEGLRPLPA